jgi:hypothetical protein
VPLGGLREATRYRPSGATRVPLFGSAG